MTGHAKNNPRYWLIGSVGSKKNVRRGQAYRVVQSQKRNFKDLNNVFCHKNYLQESPFQSNKQDILIQWRAIQTALLVVYEVN